MLRLARSFVVPAALILYASSAHAQSATQLADTLYADGKALLEQGKIPEACEKFALSQKTEPNSGTLLALATCHEKDKKIASAWFEYESARKEYARANRKPETQEFCQSKVAELGPQVQRVPMSMANKPKGVTVELDGQALGEGPLLVATPVDRGEHTVVVRAPGMKRWESKFTVTMGTAPAPIVVPALEPAVAGDPDFVPPNSGGAAGVGGTGGGAGNGGAKRVVVTEPDYTKRTIGIVVGGVGVAAGVGALIAQFAVAIPQDNKAKALLPFSNGSAVDASGSNLFAGGTASTAVGPECPQGCTQAAYLTSYESYKSAAKNAQVAAIGLAIGGGVALGIGIFLIATSGGTKQVESGKAKDVRVQPYLTLNSAGLVGSF